ncbi:peptidyl-prolyl cis-trans isomerase [Candidatus Poribacteria bacterium]|nr:peptidyl-prolyl cis-trans isomerase [Candidatus Poribacteria bacterium]
MKKILIIFVVTAAIGLSSWQIVQSQDVTGPMDESQIIVARYEWNGIHEISLATLNAEIAALSAHKRKGYQSKAGKLIFLEDLINQRLMLLAAAEAEFDKDKDFLKKGDDYKHQLMVERLTEIEVDEKIIITEETLRQYYEENKDTYVEEEKVRATCITVFDKELAQTTLEEIQAGKDMLDAVKELAEKGELTGPGSNPGDPGDTGYFARDVSARAQAFVDVVFAMEVGEMTEEVFEQEVEEDTYYMIFRKEEHQPERQQTFEEVKPRLEYPLKREMKRKRILKWLEALTAEGKLKTYPELLPPPVTPEEEEDPENEESEQ